jgi:hypothetical protein
MQQNLEAVPLQPDTARQFATEHVHTGIVGVSLSANSKCPERRPRLAKVHVPREIETDYSIPFMYHSGLEDGSLRRGSYFTAVFVTCTYVGKVGSLQLFCLADDSTAVSRLSRLKKVLPRRVIFQDKLRQETRNSSTRGAT